MRRRAASIGLAGVGMVGWLGAFGASCADADVLGEPRGEPEAVGQVQLASTGVCDSNHPVSTKACIDAIQLNGGVVNDIYKDANGLTGPELPVFGKLFNNWPGCNTSNAQCNCGKSLPPYNCPGQYSCDSLPNSFDNVANCVNALDRLWGHPYRLTAHSLVGNCPQWGARVGDGNGENYFPWEGLVFDLGGPSNKVAIFAENDHGPQPCESLEYTVYLTDNPFSQERIQNPSGEGVDPQKWNRAVLAQIFTKGWIEVRPPDPVSYGGCGDQPAYSVEEDSMVQVFSLPCGITFRYTAIVAGNDGLDFPECQYHSSEAELDAVAGLTEGGAGVCPDNDKDLYVDCACPGAPKLCDCNDADPTIHPGAPEPCDSPDVNCDGEPGGCAVGLLCYKGMCVPTCEDENASCPAGSACKTVEEQGDLCVPADCSGGGCPPGTTCSNGVCVPACDEIKCPGELVCQDGKCLDPCKDITCPAPLVCQQAKCVAPCACYNGELGCTDLPGTICDRGNTNMCVAPACLGIQCAPDQHCDAQTGTCVDFCSPDVKCPVGEKCKAPDGCVSLCDGVACEKGWNCNPETGQCEDASCKDVTCFPPLVCVAGECVEDSGAGGSGGSGLPGGGGPGAGGSTASSGSSGESMGPVSEEGGCGCRVPASRPVSSGFAAWLVLGVLGLASARRQRGRLVLRAPATRPCR
ncbi:MAG: putative metal-binding motif-containing protein [Deltaproteobacteria bacterium]|nr:putative metal-binding motif-containing protein [Deltaproteobacteria bacterium]